MIELQLLGSILSNSRFEEIRKQIPQKHSEEPSISLSFVPRRRRPTSAENFHAGLRGVADGFGLEVSGMVRFHAPRNAPLGALLIRERFRQSVVNEPCYETFHKDGVRNL